MELFTYVIWNMHLINVITQVILNCFFEPISWIASRVLVYLVDCYKLGLLKFQELKCLNGIHFLTMV